MAVVKSRNRPNRLLCDMRLVYRRPEAAQGKPRLGPLREMYKKDPAKFLAQLDRMETEHRKKETERRAAARVVEVDGGAALGLEMLERLLGETTNG